MNSENAPALMQTNVPLVHAFFDPASSSLQYVVEDPATGACAVIDPVLDYDEKSGRVSTGNAERILDCVDRRGLTIEWILDTHPHADHFSAARYLKDKTGAPIAIGAKVLEVQRLWHEIYNMQDAEPSARYWDRLFEPGDRFSIGSLTGSVLFSPGHTLASISYIIGDAAFIHDTLFMPDSGTARTDFPGGSTRQLWQSIRAILSLPSDTRLFTGHDYQPGGRQPLWMSTVAEQLAQNPHVCGVTEEEFVRLRVARDAILPMPKLILHALQVNIRGGLLPEPEGNGKRYLKIPIGAFD
jgi:glyoxylase-like metal-dependent hydrolase (beta-lactamase superfamily II)